MLRADSIVGRFLGVLTVAGIASTAFLLAGCGGGMSGPGGRWAAKSTQAMQGEKEDEKEFNTAAYDRIYENPFLIAKDNPLSTFSIDVDTASYSNVRKFLTEGKMPPKDAVRVADFINYFHYDYPEPQGEHPIALQADIAGCPWDDEHRLVRIGLQGKRIDTENMPARNLVFLIDVSGSMFAPNRLPLVQKGLSLLVEQLTAWDRVAIVVYAGDAGLRLPPTPGDRKDKIMRAVNGLSANGSTNGGEGIVQAYRVAQESFMEHGVNRVILATDGDFNVGVTNQGDLLRLIEEKRKSGVYLTVLGFGMDNLKDSTLEKLADKGAGHYAYIDTLDEARKVFVEDGAALVTIAKDVKVQVEFNPAQVGAYRLIGYENRLRRAEEFNDDTNAATPMGAGHTVTALYEIVPPGKKLNVPGVDPLKYQQTGTPTPAAANGEVLTVKVRYKEPKEEASKLISQTVKDSGTTFEKAPADLRFAASAAAFGLVLRDSPYKGNATYSLVREMAEKSGARNGPDNHRIEFLNLVETAQRLAKQGRGEKD
jgi:Ca-activated chloride channel family protein